MKRIRNALLVLLAIVSVVLSAYAVTILWYSQAPHAPSLNNADIMLIERPSPHTNMYFTLGELQTFLGTNAGGFLTLSSITNRFDNLIVTNGLTNLSLTPNTVVKADAGRSLASILNGLGALTNDNAGNFGWYNGFALLGGNNIFTGTNIFTGPVFVTYGSTTYLDSLTVTNAQTNLYLTPKTILESDANKVIASVANGTGALTNDNAGDFGWYPYFASFTDLSSMSNAIITQITNLSSVISNLSTLDTLTVTNGLTNLSLTANSIVKTDAGKQLVSLLNGLGLLTNDGAGGFGWLPIDQLTNFNDITVISNAFFNNTYISNAFITNINANKLTIQNFYSQSNYLGELTVTNGITNLSLSPSALVKTDAGRRLASVANGTGYLTNDNAGGFGWDSRSFLPLSGGTETGPVLSTSITTNAPANDEFPVAGWVRRLFNNGIIDYATTNIDGAATNVGSGQPMYTFATDIPTVSSRTYTAPNSGDYIGSVMTTNTFLFLQGPISVNAYLAALGGSGNPSVTLHPEIYYSYDKTNWSGDWEAQNQTITIGQTNLYQFVVSFPSITATNLTGFYIERRFKIGTAAGATRPNVIFLVGTNTASGTNDASHISFSGPNSAVINQTYFPTQYVGVSYSTNILTQQIDYYTNLCTMAPNFSKGYCWITTNAAFTFLLPIGFGGDNTRALTTVMIVTNSSGSPILATAPANVHVVPNSTMWITNTTSYTWFYYPFVGTNVYAVPLF